MIIMAGLYEKLREEYGGKWVATEDFNSEIVISSGKTLYRVYKKVKDNPLACIFYVPKEDTFYLKAA